MRLRSKPCEAEIHIGTGAGGTVMYGTIAQKKEELLARFAGQVQTIYLDPPFNTGKDYDLRQRCGVSGWITGKPTCQVPAYTDRFETDADYLSMMRETLELCHGLLNRNGSIFLHIDTHMHPHLRLLLDDVFGARNFVNEIIWTYQSGGRSMAHFSRKHDIILFYRKSPSAYFDIDAVGIPRETARSNHMKRGVDENGRPFRSIVSGGKEYRYYNDETVHPNDVWSDVSHMQQRDPQRTGFDNQKPIRLLERVVLCSSRPGDLVLDLFAGSGTTAVAAVQHGRRFLTLDGAEAAVAVTRKRLLGCSMRLDAPSAQGSPALLGGMSPALGLAELWLDEYQMEDGLCQLPLPGKEAVDQISAGYLRDGIFHALDNAARSRLSPALPQFLKIPVLEGEPALLTVDVLGRRMVHVLEDGDDGE